MWMGDENSLTPRVKYNAQKYKNFEDSKSSEEL